MENSTSTSDQLRHEVASTYYSVDANDIVLDPNLGVDTCSNSQLAGIPRTLTPYHHTTLTLTMKVTIWLANTHEPTSFDLASYFSTR